MSTTEKSCCDATRLAEAGAWIDTVTDLQDEVARLKNVEDRRNVMLSLHCGYDGVCCSGTCGPWPCATYLACYPETAWTNEEGR